MLILQRIISLTTISSRINHLLPVIQSLLNQDTHIDKIICYISKEPFIGNLDKGIDKIPKNLKKLSENSTFELRYTKNIGPLRKILPTLNSFPKAIIMTCDDDVIYPKFWARKLLEQHQKHPNSCIGVQIRILEKKIIISLIYI